METPALAQPDRSAPHGVRPILVLLDALESIVLGVFLFLSVSALLGRVCIESVSMEPTLMPGELVMVDRWSLRLGALQRGDVVIFRFPLDPMQQYVKRVIGLPGDLVRIRNGILTINGQRISETYIRAPADYAGEWQIPSESLFVLGDNRNRSSDSHVWGMLPRENVVGKAFFIYWPPQDAGFIRGLPGITLPLSFPAFQ